MRPKAISKRHRWGDRSELSPAKSETECARCGVVRASLKGFDDRGVPTSEYWKEYWRDGDRVDGGNGSHVPPCDARIEIREKQARAA
jgi:hypothetical protein